MDFSYPDEYSGEEIHRSSEQNNNNDDHHGRSYECVFCKRGFTTAQALGGHMNIHRKDKANKNKHSFIVPPSSCSSSSKVDHNKNCADLGFYSAIPRGMTPPSHEVDANSNHYHHQAYNFPAAPPLSHAQDWRQRNLSLYNNPSSYVHEVKDKVQDHNSDEDGLDLELRLGHHP